MGIVRFLVSEELIRNLMEMPSGARIVNISIGKMGTRHPERVLSFRFEVEDPEVPEGIHETTPLVFQAFRTWDWGIKKDAEND